MNRPEYSRLFKSRSLVNFGWHAGLLALAIAMAFISQVYHWQTDVTRAERNSLSAASRALLQDLSGRVELVAYIADNDPGRAALRKLVARYRRHKADIDLEFVDPREVPQTARELNISLGGELFVRYANAQQRLRHVNEQSLTNALQSMARGADRWLVFVTGHGERDPLDHANHAFGTWGRHLQQSGYRMFQQSLALAAVLPDNTNVLVIASARNAYLPGETALVLDYLDRGGNLLWLVEPNQLGGLTALAEELGLRLVPGTVADPNALQLGLSGMDFTLAADFAAAHAVTRDFRSMCLLPQSTALRTLPSDWQVTPLLRSNAESWSESGDIHTAQFDAQTGDTAGPLDLGIALTRPRSDGGEQRVVVIGDGDFLSNAFIDNGGNLELGLKLINWLSGDDSFIDLQRQPDLDLDVELSLPLLIGYGVTFLLALPVLLIGSGTLVWWRRKRR
ncbi:MAG: GldG family protein [Gammaproteobacteria bacterium]|nr:GldG family protein [Gammaproteobacteria bacterium]